jgi:hypothetical protein
MPQAVEAEHHGHPDFRVKGRIFATLFYRGEEWGMVKLTPAQQREFIARDRNAFSAIPGGWGLRGATQVRLDAIHARALRSAMVVAWRNVAPERLVDEFFLMEQGGKGSNKRKPRPQSRDLKRSPARRAPRVRRRS